MQLYLLPIDSALQFQVHKIYYNIVPIDYFFAQVYDKNIGFIFTRDNRFKLTFLICYLNMGTVINIINNCCEYKYCRSEGCKKLKSTHFVLKSKY